MKIPEEIRRLMGEYDPAVLARMNKIPDIVIERIMERGTLAQMRWLRENTTPERLRAYLESRGFRVLPPREVRFWSWITGVDTERADRWVKEAREREKGWRS